MNKVAIDSESGCWVWQGRCDPYGTYWENNTKTLAHRYAATQKYGSIPAGLVVRHQCHTPACVNPDHLLLGTHQDNVNDCIAAGRRATTRTWRSKGKYNPNKCKLTPDQIRIIRSRQYTYREMTKMFNISEPTIINILKRKTYSDIQ